MDDETVQFTRRQSQSEDRNEVKEELDRDEHASEHPSNQVKLQAIFGQAGIHGHEPIDIS